MTIEIIAIGSELLSGFTVNTNTSYISKELFVRGIPTRYHTVVPDDPGELRDVLRRALDRSDYVITTGGLGPTCDDMTKRTVADLFGSELRFDEGVALELKRRYGDKLISLEDQATVPEKADIIPNPFGTAPGFLFKSERSTLFLLPGVPSEMREMFNRTVFPYILERVPDEERVYCEWLHFLGVIESEVDPHLRDMKEKNPDIDFGIYPFRGYISVRVSTPYVGKKASEERIAGPIAFLRKSFRDKLFESPSGKIEEAVHQRFTERKLTLSTAESCTGGTIASRLLRVPGASEYFVGSLVTYSNAMKQKLLGVSKETLDTYGAVSREVVEEMVEGLLKVTGSEYGVAVSGVAGPSGGTEEKPVGTVWAAIKRKGEKPYSWVMRGRGSRDMIIDYSSNTILGKLYLGLGRRDPDEA